MDQLNKLKKEFEAEEGTFLFIARSELIWDKDAFKKLAKLMYDAAIHFQVSSEIPRWVAQGFWYCDTFIKDFTPVNESTESIAKYSKSCELIHDLAYFLFIGESPYTDNSLEQRVRG